MILQEEKENAEREVENPTELTSVDVKILKDEKKDSSVLKY